MAESAVSFLLDQLSTWIGQERRLLGSLSESGEIIAEEMGRLRAFLRVADEKQEVNPQLKEWVNQVRNLAYDAEDVMDEFMLRFAARPAEGCFVRIYTCIKNLKARRRLSSQMRSIQSRVKRISEGQQRYKDIYGVASDRDSRSWYDSRGDALLLEETEVVGVEKPKKQLVEWLSSSEMKVISVVGTGGLGKTTVVKKVFEDATVKARFTTHLWVTLSNSCKLEELLKTMIRKLVSEVKQPPPEGLDAMDADEMKEFVYRFLLHKTYVVVVDDIWRLEDWEAIRYAFPRSATRGFIIITTRFHSIGHAATIESNGHVYLLDPLSQQDSKALLCRKAFVRGSCPTYLEGMVDFLLNKCQGLPLAIVVIGGVLATKRNDVEEWNKLCRCLGDELESNHLNRITKLLALSYYDLPYYLKSCFLYMSVFTEDQMVFVSRLIQLWIAEGFVHPKMGKTMEEVAEEYVKELIDRSLIEVTEPPFYDRPIRIRVHDLLHSMLISKSKDQSFVTIANSGDTQWPNKIRRLVVHGSRLSSTLSWPDMGGCRHLRSLLLFDFMDPPSNLSLCNLLRTTRLLKVLELRGSVLETIPDEVFRLYHLKLLSLKGTKVKTISRLIGKLQNLETLNLKKTRVTELPVEILRLRRLRHLLVFHYRMERGCRLFNNEHSFKAPYRIGCLSSLQSLVDIDATPADGTTIVREIGKLQQLKELGIMKLREEDGNDLCISLTKLMSLETLYIASRDEDEILDLLDAVSPAPPIRSLELRGRLLKVPQWITSLQGLTRLLLKWSRIDDDPLESFQYMPNLMYLELCHAFQGSSLCFKAPGFQRLKKLMIIKLNALERLKVEEGSMPILQELCVWGCKAMDEVPSGIEHLRDLQYADFSDMSEEFVRALEKQKEEEEDNWKMGHIPKVEIYSLTHADQWYSRIL